MGRRIDLDPDGHSPAPILGSRLLTCDSACRITAIPGLSQLALLWSALFLCSQCACRLAAKTYFPHPSCALHKAPTYDACVWYLASLSFSGLSFQLPRLNLSFFLFTTKLFSHSYPHLLSLRRALSSWRTSPTSYLIRGSRTLTSCIPPPLALLINVRRLQRNIVGS
jgi:hypothetical protein